MRTAALTLLVMLVAVTARVGHASEHVLLTAGVVRAVDHANGIVILDSGIKLRLRNVIVGEQFTDVATIRVDDMVFVSGVVLSGDSEARARAGAAQ